MYLLTFRGFCSTCAIQLESCPICRQEISERKELSPTVTGRQTLSIPASDVSKISKDSDSTANGSSIPRDSSKEFGKGKYLRSKLDRNTKSSIEVSGVDTKQKQSVDSVEETLETGSDFVMVAPDNSNCEADDAADKGQSSSNHIGGNKSTVTSPS